MQRTVVNVRRHGLDPDAIIRARIALCFLFVADVMLDTCLHACNDPTSAFWTQGGKDLHYQSFADPSM